ncbi:MAG: DNRLRE domain-containing protein [Chitinophagales bacterium]
MKCFRPYVTLMALLFAVKAYGQNACFGTVYFNSDAFSTGGQNQVYVQPAFITTNGWNILSQHWLWNDGTDTLYTGLNGVYHNYHNLSGYKDVCLVTTAQQNGTGAICTDTFCHAIMVCSSAPTTNEWFYVNSINGLNVNVNAEIMRYSSMPPMHYSMDFGDGFFTPDAITYSGHIYPSFQYTYSAPGTYVLTLLAIDSLGCLTDTVAAINVGAVNCNINASFTTNQGGPQNTNAQQLDFTSTSTSSAGISNYDWNVLNGSFTMLSNSGPTGSALLNTQHYNYQVQLIVTDSIGCMDTAIQTFMLDTCNLQHTITYSLSNSNSANSDTIYYNAAFTTSHAPYAHKQVGLYAYPSNLLVASSTNINNYFVIPASGATYHLVFYATDDIGCVDSVIYTVTNTGTACNINASMIYNQGGGYVPSSYPFNNNYPEYVTLVSTSTSGQPIVNYAWSTPGGNSFIYPNTNNDTVNAKFLSPLGTSYNVQLIVTDAIGCKDTISQVVTLSSCNLTANLTANLLNVNGTNQDTINYTLNANTTHLPLHNVLVQCYNQNSGALLSSSNNSSGSFFVPAGIPYRLVYKLNDDIGCLDSSFVVINSNSNSCFGTAYFNKVHYSNNSLHFMPAYVLNPHWAVNSQTFIFGDGTSASQAPGQTVDHTYPGGYTYANACMAVSAYDSVSGSTCNDTFCSYIQMCSEMSLGLSATINGNSVVATGTMAFYGNNSVTYSVSYGDGSSTSNLIGSGSTYLTHNFQAHQYQQDGVYLMTLTATNGNGCMSDTTIAVTINTSACAAHASFTYQNLGNGYVQFINSSSSNNSYTSQWQFFNQSGVISSSTINSPLVQFTGNQPYYATLTITDSLSGACKDSLVHVQLNLNNGPTCITLKPGSAQGNDVLIRDLTPTTNYATASIVNAGYNTISGQNAITRSIIKFDLSSIPAGAVVTSARLSLYHDPANPHSINTSNDVRIAYVTSNWNESTVTWATQPTTAISGLNIGNTATTTSDKLNIDVQSFVQGWVNGTYTNYGWMLNLIGESGTLGRFQNYASSDNADSTLWPELVVCYTPTPCAASASFTYQNLGNNTIHFTNTSASSSGYYSQWVFGNGTGAIANSTAANPSFTYTGPGPYKATLIIQDSTGLCADTLAGQNIILSTSFTCLYLQPDSNAGVDAHIFELTPNTPSGNWPDFSASQWTYNSIPGEDRGLIKFDLSSIPTNATVSNAVLSLYANTTSVGGYTGQPTYGSNNASYLKFVTSGWNENTVTWNNQPATTTVGQVLLPQATSTVLDYTNINVTSFAQTWVNTPTQNNGMLLDMIGTGYYNSLIFCSSDHPIASRRPMLAVCYTVPFCAATAGVSNNTIIQGNNGVDTAILNNLSSGPIASYELIVHRDAGNILYAHAYATSFSQISRLPFPEDSVMEVCLVVHDSTGTCTDTSCITVYSGSCSVNANFTYTASGNAVNLNGSGSTGAPSPLSYYWSFIGATPSYSTSVIPGTVNYTQYGPHDICLTVTSAGGCADTLCNTITTVPLPLTDTLCGMVFTDANSNGIFDVGEQARPNSIVVIDGQNYTTASNGFYHVAVAAGTHSIALNAPPGWSQTYPTNPLIYSIATTGNSNTCGLDFGMHDDTLIISGIVYLDANGNGLYNFGEQLVTNAAVTISSGLGTSTVYTNASGFWSKMVYSGTYTISYTPQSGYLFTQPINPNTYTLTVVTNGVAGLNFGVRNNNITLSGKVYIDANNNGTYDNGEVGVGTQPVHIGNTTVYTISTGDWSVIKPVGNYTITYTPSGNFGGYTSTPASYSVNASTPGTIYGNKNFGIYIAPNTGDVCITLNPYTNVVSNMPAWYKIYVTNNGTIPMAGTLNMYFDPHFTFDNANPAQTSANLPSHLLSWHLTLAVGQTILVRPNFTCGTVSLGQFIFNAADFIPDPGYVDVNLACNEDSLHQAAESSWDPNDKQVSPLGNGPLGLIDNDQELDYTITFHNTGNAPAVNVILVDTLESDIDVNTIQLRDASHDCHIQLEGNEMTVIFSNIMLPDSATDFYGSFGFASFSAKPVQGLPDGTAVNNTAAIYFDYNDAVITNTTLNTIDYHIGINELQNVLITLQPNPFKQFTTIKVDGDSRPMELLVYDVLGNVVRRAASVNNTFVIERADLAAGMYLYELKTKGRTIGQGKMIAE